MLETTLFSTATVVVEYPIRMRMGASRLCDILDFAKFPILSNSRYCQFPDFAKFPVLSTSRFFFHLHPYAAVYRMLEAILFSTATVMVDFPTRCLPILKNSRFCIIPDFDKFPIFFTFAHLNCSI